LLILLINSIRPDIFPDEWEAFEPADKSIAPTGLLIFVTIGLAVHEMPEGDILLPAVGHDILAIFIR
jgi:hypothetical protein